MSNNKVSRFTEIRLIHNYSNDWLEELKSKCGIVEIVSQYVQLTKKGGKYFGCCPFHNEKTGSFCVNEDGQYYHCFGCGATGDVVKFIMEIESLPFMDAAKYLAEKVNYVLPEFKADAHYEEKKEKRDILFACMHDAFSYFYKNLRGANGKDARDYLLKREITEEVCNRFGLGLSLDHDGMPSYLRRKGYNLQNLTECGLIEGQSNSDAFSNRIIVPILNAAGKVVAFGGRIFHGEENKPKYKNSTNTFLFDKSKTLYGLNFVKDEKRKHGLPEVILVEGYMDVIALASHGISNCVAGMGTALTEGQAKQLVSLCKNVLVCYDGDAAGHKAAVRNVEILNSAGAEVKIISLPEENDPDDFVRKFGADGFLKLASEALPLVDFKLKLCEDAYGLDSAFNRAKYGEAAAKILAELKNEVACAVYTEEVAKKCGVNPEKLANEIKREAEGIRSAPEKIRASAPADSANIKAERCVLHELLSNRGYAKIEDLERGWFTNSANLEIFDFVKNFRDSGKPVNLGMLFNYLAESDDLNAVVNFELNLDEKNSEKYYTDSAKSLADDYIRKIIPEITAKYDVETDAERKKELVLKLSTAQQKLRAATLNGKKLGFGEDGNNG